MVAWRMSRAARFFQESMLQNGINKNHVMGQCGAEYNLDKV